MDTAIDFFNYILFDTMGTVQGLLAMSYLTNALLNGLIIAPITFIFILLSVVRITYDTIVEKNFRNVIKHVIALLSFLFLFLATTPVKVWNVNLTKGIFNGQLNTHLAILSWISSPVNSDLNNSYVRMNGVPLLSLPLSIADNFAFAVSKAVLGDENLKENLLKSKIKLNPTTLIDMAYIKYLTRAETEGGLKEDINNETLSKKLKRVAFCFKVNETLSYLADTEENNGRRKTIKKIAEDIEDLPFEQPAYSCSVVFKGIADEVKVLSKDVFNTSSVEDNTYATFFDGVALNIEKGAVPLSVRISIAEALIKQKDFITSLNNYYATTRGDESSAKTFLERAYSGLKYMFANGLTDRTFNEWFLYKTLSLAIFILLTMFPIIFTLSFLPAFGYNMRLFFSFLFTFFLVKMWLPLYLIAYEVLTGRMFNAVYSAVAFILSPVITTAYATPSEIFTLMSSAIPEMEQFNTLLLNAIAMAIPSALGGASLFLLGRDLFVATQKATAESMFLGKAGMFLGLNALSKIGLSTASKSSPGSSGSISGMGVGGGSASLSETLAGGGTKITHFKQTQSGIYTPAHTQYITQGVSSRGYGGSSTLEKGYGISSGSSKIINPKGGYF